MSWADNLPHAQGLYDPANEKDSCGVGFIVNIKGKASHSILADASRLLCNMTHRGATGSDARDGDGAGVMTGIPHVMFTREYSDLPANGEYAVGNIYFSPDAATRHESKRVFEQIAAEHGLCVLHWRRTPRDNSMIGPASASKEPVIEQPFVALKDSPHTTFNEKAFEHSLYLLRKHSTHTITMSKWFYICSLSHKNIVFKGRLSPVQVYEYFLDLKDPLFHTHFALVHSRFSTNTFPSWDRAQPMRWCAHNGEINTLRGNKNATRSREGVMKSPAFGKDIEMLFPIIEEFGSDSAAFDNVLELLVINGILSLPEAVMVMIPEAWQNHTSMSAEKKAFYEWAATTMEPWDGPALITFSDGRFVGASLDRNGLRPCRFYVTNDGRMICASEVGTLQIDPAIVVSKGRLKPGRMLLIDTDRGCIVDDNELKMASCRRAPFAQWIAKNMIRLEELKKFSSSIESGRSLPIATINEDPRMKVFGFTLEQLNMLLLPMIRDGKEALGSMGTDTPLACLSANPRSVFDYFRQLFAQVTNPPIDPIRESIVMSLGSYVGPEGNLLEMSPLQCKRLHLPSPILTLDEIHAIRCLPQYRPDWKVATVDITFPRQEGPSAYIMALDYLCEEVSAKIDQGFKAVILSDRAVDSQRVPLSSIIALGAVHQYLVKAKRRSKIALIVETGEAREVHHMCVLLGYGADAICPYLALESISMLHREGVYGSSLPEDKMIYNYKKATNDGILKVMSKMGISTLQSYKGAQIFEALGVDQSVIQRCFSGTSSRIKGSDFSVFAADAFALHHLAYPPRNLSSLHVIPDNGELHWRSGGENHINDPSSMAELQNAVRTKSLSSYQAYAAHAYEQIKICTLRGMLDFDTSNATAIPIDEVEPWQNIVKRFCTGAMSYGSISMEAHSTLAIAMNRLGGKSNTGEGGEDPERSNTMANGDSMRSAIKQVASGRFGVTSYYLSDSEELQIKMAQGAKPGEGGELPGYKVSEGIAKTRKSTVGVGLISPPPHHDIYSIEDLKQLIYDLKCSNPKARVSVKLVSEVGVGVIAAGVAKAKSDHILISGHDGGTGASRWTGIKYAGLPWELGLAETHQTLVLNDLRGRVTLQTDGQIKTGRDVALSCLLGAEEWGFATTPLIAMGCIMMRKCHLNTCPVGIATQDPELRKKFEGQAEHVINFFYYVAEEMRSIMASLGLRSVNEMVGRTEFLKVNEAIRNLKTLNIDLLPILTPAHTLRPGVATFKCLDQDHRLSIRLDNKLIAGAKPSLENRTPVHLESVVLNTDRSVGCTLSYEVSKKYGERGLPDNTINIRLTGSAGQSLGAFLAPGVSVTLEGDANDYVGKGLSGGRIVVFPPKVSKFRSHENVIVGNVCLYGATSGQAFFSGQAAERFCVRNSGALAVVEGVGDHGCEYMTGGCVINLGRTGRNFAAGMSGGIAYIYDVWRDFDKLCNQEMVNLETVELEEDAKFLYKKINEHLALTGSQIAKQLLDNWDVSLRCFVKVFPEDYRKALAQKAAQAHSESFESTRMMNEAVDITLKVAKNNEKASVQDIEDSMTMSTIDKAPVDKLRGFIKYKRKTDAYRDASKRVGDFKEINNRLSMTELKVQAARCMDCGVPYCQSHSGCPIGNIIPKWNDLVFQNNWKEALVRLMMTNNFPEFTGRVCPAPCEGACVLGINEAPVAIKSIECAIIDKAFAEGWITPTLPTLRTGKRIAIVGSGPAGLAAADQLNKVGHTVTVYDRNDRIGGLLMYGIPNMKLDKGIVQRRVDLLSAEGINFVTNAHVGINVDPAKLRQDNDALLLATGATWPRDLNITNRSLNGIHFAMEFLQANTKSLLDSQLEDGKYLSAKCKRVIVIGGGDTGNDCIGTSMRHGATSVVNFELLPQPPTHRAKDNPWPQYPRVFKVDYGHAEVQRAHGKDPRQYSVLSKEFVSDGDGNVKGINTVRVEWTQDSSGKWQMNELPGSQEFFEADLVLLALGFLAPEQSILDKLAVKTDARKNIKTSPGKYRTSVDKVYAAGDCRRGQSLIVWGINEGRQAAREIDQHLMKTSMLPVSGGIVKLDVVARESLVQIR